MLADEVPAGDALFVFVGRDRKRSHAGIGIKNVVAREVSTGESKIRLRKQIVDFPGFAPDLIRVAFKANVGSTNQIEFVPWNDKNGSPVAASLHVDRVRRRSGKCRDDDVTALSSANQLRTLDWNSLKDPIDPRSGSINHHRRLNKPVPAIFTNKLNS